MTCGHVNLISYPSHRQLLNLLSYLHQNPGMQVAVKQATPARDGGWLFVIQGAQADQREKAERDARGDHRQHH